jgi:hypothetical protein
MMAGGHLMRLLGLPTRAEIEEAKRLQEVRQQQARKASRDFAEIFSELALVIRMRGDGDHQRDDH